LTSEELILEVSAITIRVKGLFFVQYNARNFYKRDPRLITGVCVGARSHESEKIINANLEQNARQDQVARIARATVARAMADITTLIIIYVNYSKSEFLS
jgi:hypothetical protein